MRWNRVIRQTLASDFVRKVIETLATRIAGIAIGLVTSMIIARILGPDGRGLYVLTATITATAAQFGNLGLHAFNSYRVAQDREALAPLLGNSLAVSLGIGLLLGLIVLAVVSLWPAYAPVQGALLLMTLAAIPLGLATLLVQNLLLGLGEVRAYNKLDLGSKVLGIGLTVAVIALQLVSVETLTAAGLVTAVLVLAWTLKALWPHVQGPLRVSAALMKAALPYGTKAYLAALFGFLVLRSDLFLVQALLGIQAVGYYSVATALADMVYMLPVVIGTILFPKLSAMPDVEARWTFARSTAGIVALAMAGIAAIAALLAEPAIAIIYGAPFVPAAPAFVALLPGIVALSINTILMNYFASMAMPPVVIWSPLAAVVLNVILNLQLLPAIGIVGASIASSLAYGLMLASSLFYISRSRRRTA